MSQQKSTHPHTFAAHIVLPPAESVTVAPDGRLVMVDKYNQVWQAHPQRHSGDTSDTPQQDQYQLEEAPLAQLGPGRPLGFHFDNEGNLIVADSLKVGVEAAAAAPNSTAEQAAAAGEQ